MQRTPRQLDLTMPLHEGVKLGEDVARLGAETAYLRRYAEELEAALLTMRHERDAARRQVDNLEVQLRAHTMLLELQGDRVRAGTAGLPAWLNSSLRSILALSHPDRWCQGQPATELAHIVASAVNGLRERLQDVEGNP